MFNQQQYNDYEYSQKIKRGICAVNALLHNGFSNTYLSRYNSHSLDYQCLNQDNFGVIYQRHIPLGAILSNQCLNYRTHSCKLSMPQLRNDLELSMPQLGHDLVSYQCLKWNDLVLPMPQLGLDLVNYQCLSYETIL